MIAMHHPGLTFNRARRAARSTPLGNVGEGLREHPLVATRVLGTVLPFAILEVGRLHENACAVRPRMRAVGARVLHAHQHVLG
jgi:hypothetical protein